MAKIPCTIRYQWSEMLHGNIRVREPEATVRQTRGCLISDSRNVFDKVKTEVLTIKGAEKRSNIELIALKAAQQQTNLEVRWVHSEAQLSNSLTKAGAAKELELYYRMGHAWRIVEDEEMRSARKRRQAGMEPLQNQGASAPPQEVKSFRAKGSHGGAGRMQKSSTFCLREKHSDSPAAY